MKMLFLEIFQKMLKQDYSSEKAMDGKLTYVWNESQTDALLETTDNGLNSSCFMDRKQHYQKR
jgi:hypothetical protein